MRTCNANKSAVNIIVLLCALLLSASSVFGNNGNLEEKTKIDPAIEQYRQS